MPGSARDLVGSGQFATPDLPLDYNVGADEFGFDSTVYAQWIFFDYLAGRYGTEVIRQMLEASRPPGVWEVAAMNSALRAARVEPGPGLCRLHPSDPGPVSFVRVQGESALPGVRRPQARQACFSLVPA